MESAEVPCDAKSHRVLATLNSSSGHVKVSVR